VLRDKLGEARRDSVRSHKYPKERRLGALLAAPYTPRSEETPLNERIETWLTAVRSLKGVARAWTFPKHLIRSPKECAEGKYLYPGVAMLLHPPRSR
jgi:hypothetical protein